MTHLPLHDETRRAFTLHSRLWQSNRYVYPVVSRRSKGISLGINLNPDKVCNFDCIYCSVDRKPKLESWQTRTLDLSLLKDELSQMLHLALTGEIYHHDPFDKIPDALRRINDIAFSGDGEPTTCPQFADAVHLAAQLRDAATKSPIKLLLITNATMFHKPAVRDVLSFLDRNNGEIWAKLDAGTEPYYHLVDRTNFPFQKLLENLQWSAQTRPTILQTLLMKIHGNPPPLEEISAYTQRLQEILSYGGTRGGVKLVQLYTVARATTEPYATPLSQPELEKISASLRGSLPTLSVEIYP